MGTRTVTINVTNEHITYGERGSWKNCPVARAVNEAFDLPHERGAYVNDLSIALPTSYTHHYTPCEICGIEHEGDPIYSEIVIPTPHTVGDVIERYDKDGWMLPFKFKLEIPDDYVVPLPPSADGQKGSDLAHDNVFTSPTGV